MPRGAARDGVAPHDDTAPATGRFPLHDDHAIVPPRGDRGNLRRRSVTPDDPRPHFRRAAALPLNRLRPVRLLRKCAGRQLRRRLQDALIVQTVVRALVPLVVSDGRVPSSGRDLRIRHPDDGRAPARTTRERPRGGDTPGCRNGSEIRPGCRAAPTRTPGSAAASRR